MKLTGAQKGALKLIARQDAPGAKPRPLSLGRPTMTVLERNGLIEIWSDKMVHLTAKGRRLVATANLVGHDLHP